MTEQEREDNFINKLRKVLALTASPIEGEAQAAAEHLQRLLTAHNLSIADLESRGHKPKPGIKKDSHDLGKAAFTWKLNLAEAIAEHYFCHPLVDRRAKTVAFVGRPENVESLQMLYAWLIEQVKTISAQERRNHYIRTNEHVDPLRWQVNFGLGVVERLRTRLYEIKQRQTDDQTMALVISHNTEISDWLEEQFGYRRDGRPTKQQKEWQEQYAHRERMLKELKETNIEAYYVECPWERPERVAQREKERLEAEKKEARLAKRRKGRSYTYRPVSAEQERAEEQGYQAREAGRRRANDVNLEPFLGDGKSGAKEIS